MTWRCCGFCCPKRGRRCTPRTRPRARTIFLALDPKAAACTAYVAGTGAAEGDASELRVHLNGRTPPDSPAALVAAVMACLAPHIDPRRRRPPVRIRFDFFAQPDDGMLALANLVAGDLRNALPKTTRIEGFWNWRASGSPAVGVVGHRDLSLFGGAAAVTETLRQTFIDLVVQRGAETLVTGYAPGTDRAAVAAWAALGLPAPRIIFPFAHHGTDGQTVYYTEAPDTASPETTVAGRDIRDVGLAALPSAGEGHQAQAEDLLDRTDHIVFVVDEGRPALRGGSVETLNCARQMARDLQVLRPPNPVSGIGPP